MLESKHENIVGYLYCVVTHVEYVQKDLTCTLSSKLKQSFYDRAMTDKIKRYDSFDLIFTKSLRMAHHNHNFCNE